MDRDRTDFQDKRNAMAKPKLKEHRIRKDWCKGCGICVTFCPKAVLELDEQEKVGVVRPKDCICCRLCELRCPDIAIEVVLEREVSG
jgi:2-oxoglutarate ferredoxin oxidoreductase subunit delta